MEVYHAQKKSLKDYQLNEEGEWRGKERGVRRTTPTTDDRWVETLSILSAAEQSRVKEAVTQKSAKWSAFIIQKYWQYYESCKGNTDRNMKKNQYFSVLVTHQKLVWVWGETDSIYFSTLHGLSKPSLVPNPSFCRETTVLIEQL